MHPMSWFSGVSADQELPKSPSIVQMNMGNTIEEGAYVRVFFGDRDGFGSKEESTRNS